MNGIPTVADNSRKELRKYLAEHGTLRTIPKRHPTLGTLVDNIRTGVIPVPNDCRKELDENGFVWDIQRARWDLEYMLEFRTYLAEHGTLRTIPKRHPTLGTVIDNIRTGITSVPNDCRKELDENGFVWHQAACQTGERLVCSLTSLLLA